MEPTHLSPVTLTNAARKPWSRSAPQRRASRLARASIALVTLTACGLIAGTPAAHAGGGTAQTFTVHFDQAGPAIGHYGAGLLNTVNDGTISRANNSYDNYNYIKPYVWRGGLPGFIMSQTPSYDYLHVSSRVAGLSAAQTEVIINDYLGGKDNKPAGTWTPTALTNECTSIATQTSGTGVQLDLLNEPDGTSYWQPPGYSWLSTSYTDWDACYDAVRAVNPNAVIVGPSISYPGVADLETFLANQQSKGRLPNILTFHFPLPEDYESDISQLHTWMAAHGVDRQIVVQETLGDNFNYPGDNALEATFSGEAVDYMAAAEHSQTADTHACWWESGGPSWNGTALTTCNTPQMDGLLDINGNRRGQWYAYADYSAMSGTSVGTVPSDKTYLDGLASYNGTSATVLIGANDNWSGGTATVTLAGLAGLPFLSGSSSTARVVVQQIPSGYGAASQYISSDQKIAYSGDSLTVNVTLPQYQAAEIVVTSPAATFTDPVRNDNGTVVTRGGDGQLWINYWNITGTSGVGAWSGFGQLGVYTDHQPAISTSASNTFSVYYRDATTNNVNEIYTLNSSTWSSPGNLGTPAGVGLAGGVSSAADGAGEDTVVVRGTDNFLYANTWGLGGAQSWSGWVNLGVQSTDDAAVDSQSPGGRDVFYRSTGGQLCQLWSYGSTWSGPGCLASPAVGLSGAPAATAWGVGHVTVAVRGTSDNALYVASYADGAWGSWTKVGGTLLSGNSEVNPAIYASAANSLAVYYVDASTHHTYEFWTTGSGSWSGPGDAGGFDYTTPAAAQ